MPNQKNNPIIANKRHPAAAILLFMVFLQGVFTSLMLGNLMLGSLARAAVDNSQMVHEFSLYALAFCAALLTCGGSASRQTRNPMLVAMLPTLLLGETVLAVIGSQHVLQDWSAYAFLFTLGCLISFCRAAIQSTFNLIDRDVQITGHSSALNQQMAAGLLAGCLLNLLLLSFAPSFTGASLIAVILPVIGFVCHQRLRHKWLTTNIEAPHSRHLSLLKSHIVAAKNMPLHRPAFFSILGNAWVLLLTMAVISHLPMILYSVAGPAASVALMLCFSLIIIGGFCGTHVYRLFSAQRIELGIIPFGMLILTILPALIYDTVEQNLAATSKLLFIYAFGQQLSLPVLLIAIYAFVAGLGGAFFTIPLLELMRHKFSRLNQRHADHSREFFYAAFVFFGAIICSYLTGIIGLRPEEIFLLGTFINFLVLLYFIYVLRKDMLLFMVHVILRPIFRIDVAGRGAIPETGSLILIANKQNLLAICLISLACPRKIRFIVDPDKLPSGFPGFLRHPLGILPIASTSKKLNKKRRSKIERVIKRGQLICFFADQLSINSLHQEAKLHLQNLRLQRCEPPLDELTVTLESTQQDKKRNYLASFGNSAATD